jgi:hypothetical protein
MEYRPPSRRRRWSWCPAVCQPHVDAPSGGAVSSLRLTYSISSRDERLLAEPEHIELNRDMTYDDTQLLAKGAEEQLLYRDMEDSATRRIVRRLQSLKPGNPIS